MNWKLFIAKRVYRSNEGGKEVSKPAVRIAMLGIAIGLAVMIVSVAVVIGFKHEVRDKVIGLGSDIMITNFDARKSFETIPIVVNDSLLNVLYATKRGKVCTALFYQARYDYDRRQLSGDGAEGSCR